VFVGYRFLREVIMLCYRDLEETLGIALR